MQNAFVAANELEKEGIHIRVIDMASVKPIDRELIAKAAQETKAIITVEDHNIIGGLGSAVAEVVGEEHPVPIKRVGIPDIYSAIGPEHQLWQRYGLDVNSLSKTARELLEKIA